jgi:hypothetical protein
LLILIIRGKEGENARSEQEEAIDAFYRAIAETDEKESQEE